MPVSVPAPQNYATLIANVEQAADQSAQVVASAGGVPITQGQLDAAIAETMESHWNNLDPTLYDSITYANGERSFWTKASTTSRTFPSLTNSNVFSTINNKFLSPVSNYIQNETALWQFGLDSDYVPIVSKVAPAVTAASIGITLGKTVDSLLYNANPNFWDSIGMSTLNPETWASITSGDASLGASLFNMVFGINPQTGATQAYVQQEAFAYLAQWMAQQGVFAGGSGYSTSDGVVGDVTANTPIYKGTLTISSNTFNVYNVPYYSGAPFASNISSGRSFYIGSTSSADVGKTIDYAFVPYQNSYNVFFVPNDSFTGTLAYFFSDDGSSGYGRQNLSIRTFTYDSNTVSYATRSYSSSDLLTLPVSATQTASDGSINGEIAYIIKYHTFEESTSIDGIGTQDGATTPDASSWDGATTQEVIDSLRQQYPELWQNARTYDVVQPDGSTKTYTYIPTAFPNFTDPNQPVSSNSTQAQPAITPESPSQSITNITDTMAPSYDPTNPDGGGSGGSGGDGIQPTPNPSPTGTGLTPIPILPTGSSAGLFGIYNPTQAQLQQFGSWLWTGNVFEQILKLFNDPMQSIIGLHKIFVNPPISGTSTIHVGFLDSGVPSNVVGGQYVTVDCGTVNLYEEFASVFDYDPYTDVSLYLPFVGIVSLSTSDVMRSSINVTYRVDVLSGACLAEVNVMRDGAGGIIYTYSGNCAVQYPISSGTYIGILSAAIGVGSALLSGGKTMIPSIAGSALGTRAQVQHSGSFSGNAGALGNKNPYLIIERPQTKVADTFPALAGYPTNISGKLGSFSGQVNVRHVHVEGINATESELQQIESLLASGVLV